jgi:hypothetical protein
MNGSLAPNDTPASAVLTCVGTCVDGMGVKLNGCAA